MKKLVLLLFFLPFLASGQHVFKTDFQNFWTMRDSVQAATDSAKQVDAISRLYIAKASDGLKAFMRNKDNPAGRWLKEIKTAPAFWDSLKMKAAMVDEAVVKLEAAITHFQNMYPQLQPAQTYFLVGFRQQGGTIRGNLSLIGVEVVLSDPILSGKQLVRMGIHEYVHTQQKRPDFQKINVLTSSIREGACDFVAELVTGTKPAAPYMAYGTKHEQECWQAFQKEMYTNNNDNWVSTGNNPALPAPDRGYFVGYQICKAYYNKAADKNAALRDIITLDYADNAAVENFLKISGYVGGK
ncbi:MAG: DUF2268 domain-containing putative Zn-dependent protease [Bacteroidota bacterium]